MQFNKTVGVIHGTLSFKNDFVLIYSKRRRLFARTETGITRCNDLKLSEKEGVCGLGDKNRLNSKGH